MILYYVYLTTNLINGKKYVGDHGWKDGKDDKYLGSGLIIIDAQRKYGKKNFEHRILEFFDTKQEAFDAQEKYIKEYNTLVPKGYNASPKGGTQNGGCHSGETKIKIGLNNSMKLKGRKHSDERKQKIKQHYLDGRYMEIEFRNCPTCGKLFTSHNNKQYCNRKCSNGNKGHNKGWKKLNPKITIDKILNILNCYKPIKDVAKELSVSERTIRQLLKNNGYSIKDFKNVR